MRSKGLLVVALVSAPFLGGALGGCGPESVPHAPTFEADIKPIMISRCVRCHGGGGELNSDPKQQGSITGAPFYGYFDHLEDQGTCTAGSKGDDNCKRGLGYFATLKLGNGESELHAYVHAKDASRMPPPPSPTLSDRQLEVIDNWLAEPIPM